MEREHEGLKLQYRELEASLATHKLQVRRREHEQSEEWRLIGEWGRRVDTKMLGAMSALEDQAAAMARWLSRMLEVMAEMLGVPPYKLRSMLEDPLLPVEVRARFLGALRAEQEAIAELQRRHPRLSVLDLLTGNLPEEEEGEEELEEGEVRESRKGKERERRH